MSASAGPFRVLTSEVSIVDGDDELSASTARPGYSVFCFDIMVAGAKMAGLQFQNSACSHIRVAQDQGGRWVEVMGWTPLLLHDYADELELETWHFVPVTMFDDAWRPEAMCRVRVHVQYRAVAGIQAHQLRHVRCLKIAPAPDEADDGARGQDDGQDAGTPGAGVDEDPSGRRDLVATRAMTLTQWLERPAADPAAAAASVRASRPA